MKEHIETITDLLLGAAYADKRLEGDEITAISKILCSVLRVDALPAPQQRRLSSFNPAKHDINVATGALAGLSASDKRKLLELIATVNESDEVIDFAEDAYLRKVAEGLGFGADEIAALTIEVLSDDALQAVLVEDA